MIQRSLLLNLRQLDFCAKDTGEEIKGYQLTLARPCVDTRYEGQGMFVYRLTALGAEALARYPSLVSACSSMYLRQVDIDCAIRSNARGGLQLIPQSVIVPTGSGNE